MLFICQIGLESSGTRQGREPTTGEQYFPGSGHQSGTAAEETTGGRNLPAQKEKPGFWNGDVNVNLYLRV